MAVGIGNWEWVRGVVVAVKDEEVGVRIDEPGSYGHFKAGRDGVGRADCVDTMSVENRGQTPNSDTSVRGLTPISMTQSCGCR